MRRTTTTIATLLLFVFSICGQTPHGSVNSQTVMQPGTGAVSQSVETVLRAMPRQATAYGAVCNGVTNPSAANYHDDSIAIMNAHNSLPANGYEGGVLQAGVVIVPITAPGALFCVIGTPMLWSPYVALQGAGQSQAVTLLAADNFAPQVGNAIAITGVGSCGGGTVCTVTAPGHGFANGDTVEIHGVIGPWQINAWGNSHNYPTFIGGMWTVGAVTTNTFQLVGSDTALPAQVAYVSGGTAVKGTEKFVLTILNRNYPSSPYPNNNFDVDLGNISIGNSGTGNEFTSGIYCNCSLGTHIHHLTVGVPFRQVVFGPGFDNILIDALSCTIQGMRPSGAATSGPDPQCLVMTGSTPLLANSVHIRSLKVDSYNWFTAQTPAVVLTGGGIVLDVPEFEAPTGNMWPIWIDIASLTSPIELRGITAHTDTYSGTCPTMGGQVVAITGATAGAVGTGVKISGWYECYTAGVVTGSNNPQVTTPDPNLTAPSNSADLNLYSLQHDDTSKLGNYFPTEGAWSSSRAYIAGEIVTYGGSKWVATATNTNEQPNVSPSYWNLSYWAVSPNFTTLNYFNGGGLVLPSFYTAYGAVGYPRPTATPSGTQCWLFWPGSAAGDSNPSFDFWSYGSCVDTSYNPHLYARFSQAGGCPNGPPNGYRVCLDPFGVEGAGTGGNFSVGGTLLVNGLVTMGSYAAGVAHFVAGGGLTSSLIAATDLATTGATAGTYGDATHTVTVTINAEGQVTAASQNLIPSGSFVTGVSATSSTCTVLPCTPTITVTVTTATADIP